MEKSRLFNREKLNRLIAGTLSFLFIMQQSLCYQVIALQLQMLTEAAINKNPQTMATLKSDLMLLTVMSVLNNSAKLNFPKVMY